MVSALPSAPTCALKIAGKVRGTNNLQFYDGDDPANAELVNKYGAAYLPTLVFLDREGNILSRMEGARTELQLETEFLRLGWTV